MTDRQRTYEAPELRELGAFEDLTLGGGFVFDEQDGNEALFGSTDL